MFPLASLAVYTWPFAHAIVCFTVANTSSFGMAGGGGGAGSALAFALGLGLLAGFDSAVGCCAMAGAAIQATHDVPAADLPFEFAMNALRLADGFTLALFTERTGLPSAVLEAPLARAESQGLVERDAFSVRPTPRGRRFLNDLLGLFVPEAQPPQKG